MQKFQCHKVVHAAKIVRVEGYLIDGVTLHFEDGESIAKDATWSLKFTPGEGQYYVVYSDGYASISPAKAFEEGYHAIDDGLVSEFPVIAMGHGKIEVGNASWEGLPALFFGNDGQGLGVERQRNGAARDGETLMLITFANIQGLEAIEKAVARVREDMGHAQPDTTYESLCASWHAAQSAPRRMPWRTAVEILSAVKKLPPEEREKLLALDDAT
jgi:hypothetical protein